MATAATESSKNMDNIKSLPRKRIAKGPARPRYLANRDMDRMMIMFVTLMGEVSALRDRLDTHEALADAGKPHRTEEVESFKLSEQREAQREQQRLAMARRVFRVMQEELDNSDEAVATGAHIEDLPAHT
jgi:hypothetical protein